MARPSRPGQVIADAMRRAVLVLFAATLLLLTLGLASAAIVLGLHEVMPLWAAFALVALLFALLAGILLLAATRRTPGAAAPTDGRDIAGTGALAIGEAVGGAVRQRPKTAMAAAFAIGIALGANPGLRRDLIALLGTAAKGAR